MGTNVVMARLATWYWNDAARAIRDTNDGSVLVDDEAIRRYGFGAI